MTKTNLVLLTGFPASGKSTVARRLTTEYGFAVLSSDDLRKSLFGLDYGELVKDGKKKEEVVREIMDYSKLQILGDGYDLVIDTSAPTEKFRRRMLEIPESLEESINKAILYVKSDEQIRQARHSSRGGLDVATETIQKYWSEPQNGFMNSRLYYLENNGNLEDLYQELDGFYRGLKLRV